MAIMVNVSDSSTIGKEFFFPGFSEYILSSLRCTFNMCHQITTELEECQPKAENAFDSSTHMRAMSESPNFVEQTRRSRFLTRISEAKGSCSQTLDALDLLEKFQLWPCEETAKPLKLLSECGKSIFEETSTQEDIDNRSGIVRSNLDKKRSAEQYSDQKIKNCENTNLEYDSKSQPCSTFDEAWTLANGKEKIFRVLPNFEDIAAEGCGKRDDMPEHKTWGNNQSEKRGGEKTSSDSASTFTGESKNKESMRHSSEDLSFSVQQDCPNDRDCLSLSNQPLTSVATTLYNNYKLLFLTLAERLLSSDAEELKNWASQTFSIHTSQKVTDVLFQLDYKEIINVSDLSPLKQFFESIVRFDLVYIIDAFLLGDYDVLRYNPRKPEVDANREQRPRQRARSDYTNPLSGVSFHSASLQNVAEGNPEALRRRENNDEVQTLIPHLPSQTPFPTFPTHQRTKNRKHTSTYQDENASSTKYGQQSLEPNSTRFTRAVVVADSPVKRDNRLRSSNSSASANPTVNQRTKTQTVGSNGFKLSKPRQPDTVQTNSRSPHNQAPDDDQDVEGNWLCNHYKRRCFVKFECCDKFWPCHRCHNNQSTCGRKKLKSRDTKMLKCANCSKVQEFGQYCRDCNAKFATYYCGLCKHLTGTDDHPYHCNKCGICRIHGNRSFHCDICGVCLDVQLRGNHKCREGSAHDECCICLEDAFTGCQILPCSHKVHKECATQMIRSGIRRCPICRESFAHKLERRPMSDPKNRSGK